MSEENETVIEIDAAKQVEMKAVFAFLQYLKYPQVFGISIREQIVLEFHWLDIIISALIKHSAFYTFPNDDLVFD